MRFKFRSWESSKKYIKWKKVDEKKALWYFAENHEIFRKIYKCFFHIDFFSLYIFFLWPPWSKFKSHSNGSIIFPKLFKVRFLGVKGVYILYIYVIVRPPPKSTPKNLTLNNFEKIMVPLEWDLNLDHGSHQKNI